LGFTDVRILENGESFSLAPGLQVTSYWDDPVDSVLLIAYDDHTILHQNDCTLNIPTLEKIARRGPIDYAFLNYTWIQDLYPCLLPRPADAIRRLVEDKERD